jgi:hypothetical protein
VDGLPAYQYNPSIIFVSAFLSAALYVSVLMYAAKLADEDASTPVTWW